MTTDTDLQGASDPVARPNRPEAASPVPQHVRLPGDVVFYACLAGLAGGVALLPVALWRGWPATWLAVSVIAGVRGFLVAVWVVMADRLATAYTRPPRWGLAMVGVGLVPDVEIGLYAYIVFVERGIDYPIQALGTWVVVAALRDGLMGLMLGWTAAARRGARLKSMAAGLLTWTLYRSAGVLWGGPLLGLPVEDYQSTDLLVQVSAGLIIAAGLIGWAFAARLRDAEALSSSREGQARPADTRDDSPVT